MPIAITIVGAVDRTLEERLRAAGAKTTSISASDLQGLTQPSSAPPDVLVIDLRGQAQIPRMLSLVKRQHPDMGLAVVASTLDPVLMLEAMRSGVTECVTETAGGELEAAVMRLAAQRVAPVSGEVFAFVGAKGGVGTTTAAVNVATALSKFGPTLIIDLHLAGGDAALYLGVSSQFSVIDALENTHRLDVSYFRGLLTATKAGPDLLASADRSAALAVDSPRVRTLIDFASRHYRYTVLDIPRSDAAILDALEGAASLIIVANQELATVRGAGRLATALRQRYGADKIAVVLSRSDRHAEIGLEDLTRVVGTKVTASFPSDYRLAVKALNRGQPLVLEKGALATGFQDYARMLAGAGPAREPASEKSSGILGILTGRR
ncbi:MAG: AAA family ATPase [Vicinamibacterales bacterium]